MIIETYSDGEFIELDCKGQTFTTVDDIIVYIGSKCHILQAKIRLVFNGEVMDPESLKCVYINIIIN